MKKKPKKKKSNIVRGMTATIAYDRRRNVVSLKISGRSKKKAGALYLFTSVQKHPAVHGSSQLNYVQVAGEVRAAEYAIELSVDPSLADQLRLGEPASYVLPPEAND